MHGPPNLSNRHVFSVQLITSPSVNSYTAGQHNHILTGSDLTALSAQEPLKTTYSLVPSSSPAFVDTPLIPLFFQSTLLLDSFFPFISCSVHFKGTVDTM